MSFQIPLNDYYYIGDKDTDGSYRFAVCGLDISIHPFKRIAGVWVDVAMKGNKDYSFNSPSAGTEYITGYRDWSATSVTLTQASLTQTYGTANSAYFAHAGIVAGGAGTVDTGQVGLRAKGVYVDAHGNKTTSLTVPTAAEIITDDITTLSLDEYAESSAFWIGTITYELYVVSGAPTAYSLTFNYGFEQYDDLGDIDFKIFDFEVQGTGNASDSDVDIILEKHEMANWTYAASGFTPGNGVICSFATDVGEDIVNNEKFRYKRKDLNATILGASNEGFLIRVVTGTNNSIRNCNLHVSYKC